MLKQKSVLEVKLNERLYSLELDPLSPLGEVYDAINQIRGYVIERINAENKASQNKAEEKSPESEKILE